MNDNVVDFMQFLEKKKIEGYSADIVAKACLLALTDITQDINNVLRFMQGFTKETGADSKEIIERMVKSMTEENACGFEWLLRRHIDNLDSIYRCVKSCEACGDDSALTGEMMSEIIDEYATSGATRIDIRLNEIVSHMLYGEGVTPGSLDNAAPV